MTATVEVVSPGALATLQDLGRPGLRRFGVPGCGALDPALLRIANLLAGNAEGAAAIEFFVAGPTLKAIDAPVQLGLAGDFSLTLVRANGERTQLDAWRSVTLWPGDTLRAASPRSGRTGVVAVRGLAVPLVLGSASTYTRAQLGGHAGRALAAGDKLGAAALPLKAGMPPLGKMLRRPPAAVRGAIRVVPGPQADHFDARALEAFFASEYQVSAEADRMGVRLQGPALLHNHKGREIVSDATVPGSIQVPGNGQPIVLLADGQTAGGYPKIATVISADLPRLAVAAVGALLRFEAVTVAQAEALAREREAALRRLLASIEPLVMQGGIDLDAIYNVNLVGGMIDALDPN
jgi:allophanate hydrolase